MRNTKQKILIKDLIDHSYCHLTAMETYAEAKKVMPKISLGTVYRILNELTKQNLILRITTESGIDHFDRLPKERHAHFICTKCNKIVDVFNVNTSFNKDELKGYSIDSINLTLTGVCNDCQKGKEK